MIYGIGTDITEVERIKNRLLKNPDLKLKIFSSEEIAYCEKQVFPEQHYAGKFAAKESFLKAIGTGLRLTFDINQVEILNEDNGRPVIRLSESLKERTADMNFTKVHLSISHSKSAAIASVVIEADEN